MDIICTCAGGTEKALKFELRNLGAEGLRSVSGAVEAQGGAELIARANVFLRTAMKVLVVVARFDAPTEDELVARLSQVPFEEHLASGATFAVTAHLSGAPWTNTHFAAQRVKDVVVDRFRALGRARPNVDTHQTDLRFVLHWARGAVTFSIDTSGTSLHRRGYRAQRVNAPLRETLAASVLAIAHADVQRPFLDPCCGSGTLPIEQAWRSLDRAPNPSRRFAFETWPAKPEGLTEALALARQEARDRVRDKLQAPIYLSDFSREAVDNAEASLKAAGLDKLLTVRRQDARKVHMDVADQGPVVCANLPYGERLGKEDLQLDGFYRTLGDHLRTFPSPSRIIVLSALRQTEELLDLGKCKQWMLYNGPMKVALTRWDR
jgi:putative N6-adenine-specific DNA methylase